ncbi:MAG TPA: prolyl oligopeptidase family serine peptidase [Solirubrobacteraceae bacterium]
MDVGTRVYEYGGGAYAVGDAALFYVDGDDGQIHRRPWDGAAAVAITGFGEKPGRWRYADLQLVAGERHLLAVREDRRTEEPRHEIVAVACDGSGATVLVSGADFYASPRPRPDGRGLAWISWNHPAMPWDASELWRAELTDDLRVHTPTRVAGGVGESVFQPEWGGPSCALHLVSDRSGWWNLYREEDGRLEPLAPAPAEFGWAQWLLGLHAYTVCDDGAVVCMYTTGGRERLGYIRPGSAGVEDLGLPHTSYLGVRGSGRSVRFAASSPYATQAVFTMDLDTRALTAIRPPRTSVEAATVSTGQQLEIDGADGTKVPVILSMPFNESFEPIAGELPPLLVVAHGGPVGQVLPELRSDIQFWTSRGFAVAEVNYAGSTGHGRAHRERLKELWGVADVDDCVAAARDLASRGLVDPSRTVIRGASAGGFTALCSLVRTNVFAGGAAYYGISDLRRLAATTHKFESFFLTWLIGPLPEAEAVYDERSPLRNAEAIEVPVLFLHGTEDHVVPLEQSAAIAEDLRRRGVFAEVVEFCGEGHGFGRESARRRALEAELAHYGRLLGLAADGPAPPLAP